MCMTDQGTKCKARITGPSALSEFSGDVPLGGGGVEMHAFVNRLLVAHYRSTSVLIRSISASVRARWLSAPSYM
jgi:hypothetical protein